jgi:hypothetical protein
MAAQLETPATNPNTKNASKELSEVIFIIEVNPEFVINKNTTMAMQAAANVLKIAPFL